MDASIANNRELGCEVMIPLELTGDALVRGCVTFLRHCSVRSDGCLCLKDDLRYLFLLVEKMVRPVGVTWRSLI